MIKIETTTDALRIAEILYKEAFQVTDRNSHVQWWDKKVEVLQVINEAFETGYYTGEATAELRQAKYLIYRAETIAGEQALKYEKMFK